MSSTAINQSIDLSVVQETFPAQTMEPDTKPKARCDTQSTTEAATKQQPSGKQELETTKNTGDNNNEGQGDTPSKAEDQTADKNDSSTLSTAFTISFEDETTDRKKLFGIRDSIRKFAPPKPNTIEKPRPSKNDSNQDNSYMSIESAPGGFAKNSLRRELDDSCRSSGRKSNSSSRHSNISDSAAFLIDKMLNTKEDSLESPTALTKLQRRRSSPKKPIQPGEDVLDDEIDFCEDKSDNGTYIVGADPESDAARKKIDELFGVVKAAEASLMAKSSIKRSPKIDSLSKTTAHQTRQSRVFEKKSRPMSQERQEHINRLATGRNNSSRSSSSSRHDVISVEHRPRAENRHRARNTSCDRVIRPQSGRPRRATSQSSRHSSNPREASDLDTRSSRSSLQTNDIDSVECASQSIGNVTSMKFNRAFALRRARLGLGDPAPVGRVQVVETETNAVGGLSPRRNMTNMTVQRTPNVGANSQNLSRNDGGRFSLRMRNSGLPNSRLSSLHSGASGIGRPGHLQHNSIVDSYINKVSSSAKLAGASHLPSQHSNLTYSSMPYQSADENEPTLSPSHHSKQSNVIRMTNMRVPGIRAKGHRANMDLGNDFESIRSRFNYSLAAEDETNSSFCKISENVRACSSTGRRGSSVQLGALDSLVISAISGLSLKIRSSCCDLMHEHAKRLPPDNETRLVVEEILPQLSANASRSKSPTSIEEIDQSLYFDLAQTLKNLKKIEQMMDVMKTMSSLQTQTTSSSAGNSNSNSKSSDQGAPGTYKIGGSTNVGEGVGADNRSNTNSEANSLSSI